MLNAVGRAMPTYIEGAGDICPFQEEEVRPHHTARPEVGTRASLSRVVLDIRSALTDCRVRDGVTLSFHHHLRNGDHVMNMVLTEAGRMGLRNLKVAATAIFGFVAVRIEGRTRSIYEVLLIL